MYDVIPVKVTDVKELDELKNGETVIDTWQDGNGFCLHLERESTDGTLNYHTVSYPLSAYVRLRKYEQSI